jgi:glycosyltransferase involved in cell wall biosynthesis
MSGQSLTILAVSPHDVGGGAEQIALDLWRGMAARGDSSWLVVGRRTLCDERIVALDAANARDPAPRVSSMLKKPLRRVSRALGIEDFDFPLTRGLVSAIPSEPDVVHLHNLHGGYFDLRALSDLSHRTPVLMTLHDAWLTTGHCAHSIGCERWKTGCGQCPDLDIYPAVARDATNYNWNRKGRIYRRSRLHVVTPSAWLMDQVNKSIVAPAIVDQCVIPNGVDTALFRPRANDERIRDALRLPRDRFVILVAGNALVHNPFKDFDALRDALAGLPAHVARRTICVALGGGPATTLVGSTELRLIPFVQDRDQVAAYFRAADLFVHAAKADTFPNVVLEAMASGVPVVATRVGGIPEQVLSMRDDETEGTGELVALGDRAGLADAIAIFADRADLRLRAADNARRRALACFRIEAMIERYALLYRDIARQNGPHERD